MSTSMKLLGKLEDARQELTALERQDKRGRNTLLTATAILSAMATIIIVTGNGIFAWLLCPALALGTIAPFDLYQTHRRIRTGTYSWDLSAVGRLDLARIEVRTLERQYADAVMREEQDR